MEQITVNWKLLFGILAAMFIAYKIGRNSSRSKKDSKKLSIDTAPAPGEESETSTDAEEKTETTSEEEK
ncbi:hypothetical protein SAMN05444274_10693 [Mariniphaga anaerophila]|uniref:Uncharacterized protein n=1 Tax=Mariniphaga anaerophila TaxID=1484053 RepID=A0A1M5CF15_9BACT|nr:hypothetical protein [Mariniphaga anaerophila]SHF53280.1 hypothetical protein SAMN05444274_10693 [Mariniphaga anaerophila]